MKQKISILFWALLLCFITTANAQGPTKPKLCATCGKMVVNCPYKGNHPKCATCGKLKEKCAYKGNHPVCSTCGKLTENCPYKGNHPKCTVCGKSKEQCPYHGSHPKCATCGQFKENCYFNGNHPVCVTCGKVKEECTYRGNHPKCAVCGKVKEQCPYGGEHPVFQTCGDYKDKCKYGGEHPNREVFQVKGISFTMIRVEGGDFMMGATPEQGEDAKEKEKPAHEVSVPTFYIAETEVTQGLWEAVMESNPATSNKGADYPINLISLRECWEFIKKLNALTNRKFRLPSEEEWEYAARGGNQSKGYKYSGSNNCNDVAVFENWSVNKKTGRKTFYGVKTVKSKLPNELGIYDMSGNVREYTSTHWRNEYNVDLYIVRGGDFSYGDKKCRVSFRDDFTNDKSSADYEGFRLAL